MHGTIFLELKKFVVSSLGAEAWNKLAAAAGVEHRVYLGTQAYPDAELVSLVTTASGITGKPAAELLEAFGEFIVPDLVSGYKPHINPNWKTLDLLEHAENTIHRVVRATSPGATPPELKAFRKSPSEVVIHYASARKMCPVAIGITRGVAKHYQEKVEITQPRCMHRGDPTCELEVKLVAA